MSTERKHHDFSPSTLASLEACPCYESQQAATPHERTVAGTKAHGVAESGIDDPTLSDEDAAHAADCLDFVEERRNLMEAARKKEVWRLAVELAGNDSHPDSTYRDADEETPPVQELKEVYWPIDEQHTTAGYADHVLVSHDGKRAEVLDWKFGRWKVADAKTNPQGIAYVLGVFHRFPLVELVTVFFKQPVLSHMTEAQFTRAQIPELFLRIRTIVERAKVARAAGDFEGANPGAPNCCFCKNIGRCPAVAKFALQVGSKFSPLQIPSEGITPSSLMNSRDTTLGLQLAQVLAVWSKSFRTQVTDRVLRGDADAPAGFKLTTRQTREVVDADKYKTIALRYLSPEQFEKSCEILFGKVEDWIKQAAPRGQKKAALENFNAELESEGAVAKSAPYAILKAVETE